MPIYTITTPDDCEFLLVDGEEIKVIDSNGEVLSATVTDEPELELEAHDEGDVTDEADELDDADLEAQEAILAIDSESSREAFFTVYEAVTGVDLRVYDDLI